MKAQEPDPPWTPDPTPHQQAWSDARVVCGGMTAGEIRQALIRDVREGKLKR